MTMSHLAVHCNSACMQIDRKTTFVYNAISNQPSKLVMVSYWIYVRSWGVNAELKGWHPFTDIIREVKDAQHVFQKLQGFVFAYGTAI